MPMPAATAMAVRLATTLSLAMVVITVRMAILRCDFAQCERSEENKKREGMVLPVSKLLVVPRVRGMLVRLLVRVAKRQNYSSKLEIYRQKGLKAIESCELANCENSISRAGTRVRRNIGRKVRADFGKTN